jgi:hypothetical protein
MFAAPRTKTKAHGATGYVTFAGFPGPEADWLQFLETAWPSGYSAAGQRSVTFT